MGHQGALGLTGGVGGCLVVSGSVGGIRGILGASRDS